MAFEVEHDEALPLIWAAFSNLKGYDHGVRKPRKFPEEEGMV